MKQKILKKIYKIFDYYKKNGFIRFVRHIIFKVFHAEEMNYKRWLRKNKLSKKELDQQRLENFNFRPLFSIVVPLYRTIPIYLKELVESIQKQTYGNWELCLSDGSGKGKLDRSYLEFFIDNDPRVKFISSEIPLSISENTNNALGISTGDFIVFVDHDDILAPNALYECVKVLNRNPELEIIYTDEDKVSMDGKTYFQPHFKSDFNLDLLRSMNYICHMFVVKHALQKQVGNLKEEYNGAQDYDFILRCVEKSEKIYHIPKILYHWRAHKESTSENPESKLYAFEAGKRAIEAHLDRLKVSATVEMGEYLGLYRVRYQLKEEPLVSVLIPNRDHMKDLQRCIYSLFEKSNYKNIEVIIIENGSESKEIFKYYDYVREKYARLKVVSCNQGDVFNYSVLNNYGEKATRGEYILLLNNDIEFIRKDSIEEMVSCCEREEVGAVGAKLLYPDDTIQHAGVILGLGGIAGHAFKGLPHEANGYFSRAICMQNYTAVTAACMMLSKSLFEEVGGFDEKLQVAFNDIDLCMKIRQAGKLIVYTPFAQFYHYESKSRGLEDTEDKVKRFNSEINYFAAKWKKELENGDPYYNNNLTLEKHDFSLKII